MAIPLEAGDQGFNLSILAVEKVYDFFAPILMSLAISQIEDHKFILILVEVFYFVGDDANGDLSEVDKEVILMIGFVEKEVHEVVLEDAVEVNLL